MIYSTSGTPPTVVVDPSTDLASMLQATNAKFRGGQSAVFVARLDCSELSVGIGHSPNQELVERCRQRKIPILRRPTGGTAVLHAPGDIAWSLVLPRNHARVGRDFVKAYGRLGEGITQFLATHDVDAAWVESPGISHDYCLLGARGQVLQVGSRVLGGAAQQLAKAMLLHHGILPARIDERLIHDLFDLTPRTIRERLTALSEIGIDPAEPRLLDGLADSLASSVES
ncbi:MAG: hypothetical protein WB778_01040 [Thermoplasmata archaeon]